MTSLGSQHTCDNCVAWSTCGTLNNGIKYCSSYFDWLLGTYSSDWIALSSFHTRAVDMPCFLNTCGRLALYGMGKKKD